MPTYIFNIRLFKDEFIQNIINIANFDLFHSLVYLKLYSIEEKSLSFGALLKDLERYLSVNNFSIKILENHIEIFYSNIGKPVFIVVHLYLALLTLTNLLKKSS